MSGLMPWDSIVDLIKAGVERIWPDKTEAAKLTAQIDLAAQQGQLQELQAAYDNARAQLDVNKAEAASTSLFVAGWRPFIGWVCGSAFAWSFVAQPFFIFWAKLAGAGFDPAQLPTLDFAQIQPVLYGMLGLGAMRTIEKLRGAAPSTHG